MELFSRIKTYFTPEKQALNPNLPSTSNIQSFQVIMEDVLDESSRDFEVLGDWEEVEEDMRGEEKGAEVVSSMYVKGFLLIGQRCEGRALTVGEWRNMIQQQNLSIYSKKDIYFSIFKGVDFTVRKDVWQLLANTAEMKKMTNLTYEQLANPKDLPPSEADMIEKDVVRTIGITEEIGELRRILTAYVNLRGKSYVQGMNLIGGILLRLLSLTNEHMFEGHEVVEEEWGERVFWVFVGVMKWKGWEEVFEPNMVGLTRMLDNLRTLMAQNVPRILEMLDEEGLGLGIFAQCYVTICLYGCPIELSKIILDLFLLDGEMVVHSLLIRMLVVNQ